MSAERLDSESKPRVDTKSSEYYRDLRESLIDSIGIRDQYGLNDAVRTLTDELSKIHTIDTTLESRRKNIIDRLKGIRGSDDRRADERFSEKFADGYSTSALRDWKERISASIEAIEESKLALDMFEAMELDPYIHELFTRYGKEKLSDLLSPGVPITPEELKIISIKIQDSIEFRNRKIGELLAYRYARKADATEPIEEFINDAHSIVKEKKEWDAGYRSNGLRGKMTVLFPTWAVPDAMKELGARIDLEQPSLDQEDIQNRSLKYYILFELIHPFSDGNGRTGRALFVHLQKRFSEKRIGDEVPLHIPIARFESGTMNPDMVESDFKASPGSLSLDVGTLLDEIMKDPSLVSLDLDLFSKRVAMLKTGEAPESEKIDSMIRESITEVMNVLDSEEMKQRLGRMLLVIESQSKRDFEHNEDWKIVSESMKKKLRGGRDASV